MTEPNRKKDLTEEQRMALLEQAIQAQASALEEQRRSHGIEMLRLRSNLDGRLDEQREWLRDALDEAIAESEKRIIAHQGFDRLGRLRKEIEEGADFVFKELRRLREQAAGFSDGFQQAEVTLNGLSGQIDADQDRLEALEQQFRVLMRGFASEGPVLPPSEDPPVVAAPSDRLDSVFPADGLVKVTMGEIGGKVCPVVDARELHGFLGVKKDFSDWVKAQIQRTRLKENRHFALLPQKGEQTGRGGHNRTDYILTLHGAMHVAMASNTDKAYEVRDYFIECEERLNAIPGNPVVQALPAQPATVQPETPSVIPLTPQVFHYKGHALRVVLDESCQPWFAAVDVLRALGYAASPGQIINRLLGASAVGERQWFVLATGSRVRAMYMLSATGVSSLLGKSAKPEAAVLHGWLAKEVLPHLV